MEDNQSKARRLRTKIFIIGASTIALSILLVTFFKEDAPFWLLVPVLTVIWIIVMVLIIKYLVLIFRR